MAPKKSVFRGPDAQHFQLVHRSQRDPLINDPDASQRVLKPVERGNDKKAGYTLADLDKTIDKTAIRDNEGEAAQYGITYDDSSYDYMAHLRPVQGGFDSFLIPAPKGSTVAKGMKPDRKGKGRAQDLFVSNDVLASQDEVALDKIYAGGENVPRELQGLQPDMDPHLRQVLEALEDDAFVEDGEEADGEGWWGELVLGGETDETEREQYDFHEAGVETANPANDQMNDTWESRFQAFKERGDRHGSDEEDDAERSEMADTVGSLVSGMDDMMVKGGKKRRGKRGPSDATGMSMSSSSMFRNQGLRDLDDRFDQVERAYEIEDDEDEWSDDGTASIAGSTMSNMSHLSRASLFSSSCTVPDVSREDFDAILDDFLENYEVVGKKLQPALGGTGLTGAEKLRVLRAAVEGEGDAREENRQMVLRIERESRGLKAAKEKRTRVRDEEGDGDKWDVETILTTYTNTENHPAMIRTRTAEQVKRKAALKAQGPVDEEPPIEEDEEDDSGSETETEDRRVTVARPKGESADARKARKAAVKAERAARRTEKREHKATFGDERKRQLASHKKMVGGGRASDVVVGSKGVVSLR